VCANPVVVVVMGARQVGCPLCAALAPIAALKAERRSIRDASSTTRNLAGGRFFRADPANPNTADNRDSVGGQRVNPTVQGSTCAVRFNHGNVSDERTDDELMNP
jgi:hypothetical protein